MIDLISFLASFSDSIEEIKEMPEFFKEALSWGIEASFKALGFMALMALTIKLFK